MIDKIRGSALPIGLLSLFGAALYGAALQGLSGVGLTEPGSWPALQVVTPAVVPVAAGR